jgi:hypothetical protein
VSSELERNCAERLAALARKSDPALVKFCEDRQLKRFEESDESVFRFFLQGISQSNSGTAAVFKGQLDQYSFAAELVKMGEHVSLTKAEVEGAISRIPSSAVLLEMVFGSIALTVATFAGIAQIYDVVSKPKSIQAPAVGSPSDTSASTTPPVSSTAPLSQPPTSPAPRKTAPPTSN